MTISQTVTVASSEHTPDQILERIRALTPPHIDNFIATAEADGTRTVTFSQIIEENNTEMTLSISWDESIIAEYKAMGDDIQSTVDALASEGITITAVPATASL